MNLEQICVTKRLATSEADCAIKRSALDADCAMDRLVEMGCDVGAESATKTDCAAKAAEPLLEGLIPSFIFEFDLKRASQAKEQIVVLLGFAVVIFSLAMHFLRVSSGFQSCRQKLQATGTGPSAKNRSKDWVMDNTILRYLCRILAFSIQCDMTKATA